MSDNNSSNNTSSNSDEGLKSTEGNAVFSVTQSLKTSDLYKTGKLPERFENPDVFKGYGTAKGAQNPLYMTSNSSYGMMAPNVHTMPKAFHGRTQKFSEHLGKSGMPTNSGLSTAMDKSKVHSSLDN
eukprot:m.4123 g.4123  ORF g.4123 m.4123 type:complete len:127 (-) comp3814_c0_seq1:46-426(-)